MAYLSMGEAHRRINDYLNRFSDAVSTQDGASLKQLLSLSSNNPAILSLADALNVFQDANRLIKQSDNDTQFGEILVHLFRAFQSYRVGSFIDSYQAFEKSANAFIQEFRNWDTAWALQALYVIAYEIRVLAERADKELASNGKSPEKLKGAGSFLMKVFGVLAGKGPKRVGALYVTCQLFKVYFKLGTVHLCRSVIRSIETARIFDFEEFPKRDKVTYMYYTGRLEVFNENFPAADHKLSYALRHCNPQSEANIRMILKYLIPVKLSIGILPNDWLLEKHNLVEYKNVVQALKRGDLRLLRHALEEHEDRFLRSGVYLVLEKLELQVYQRLIKKIYIIQKQKDPIKAHQLKLEVIVKALKWLEISMDLDEVECIVAILIYKNLVKGYFAHKSKVVVLSKQDPFPKLNGKPVNS
ncbi:PREDICTED: PCI [Prunus dulcis]|uniref:PREDICTED: PCI n=1 Tax=Prunus dulcis TaxID=3755 RepID=A0A5E4E963_PRUDU|nr:enhanced ethylene response protein 5 [Prunus dulcis]VVA10368.1 PREDICTED: PCI [Prunus dulcis]